jgi:hypothetical protein
MNGFLLDCFFKPYDYGDVFQHYYILKLHYAV